MVCPKCGTKIKKTDLSPYCKKCGAHIMYYTQEKDLAEDAKKTELEFAKARFFGAKLKRAFIQDKFAILRLITVFLGAAALLIPLFSMEFSFPWWEYKLSVGAIGFYKIISDSFWKLFSAVTDIGILSPVVIEVFTAFTLFALSVIAYLVSTVLWALSFIDLKKFTKWLVPAGTFQVFLSGLATVISVVTVMNANDYSFVSASFLPGSIISLAASALFTFSNIMILKNCQKLKIKDADKKRLEIAKQVHEGSVDLESLPLPIVEENEEKGENKDEK